MTRRLQALVDEEDYREIQDAVRRERVTLAEWVRQAMRRARSDHPGAVEAKPHFIDDASRHEFPTADKEVMLQEIEARGPRDIR